MSTTVLFVMSWILSTQKLHFLSINRIFVPKTRFVCQKQVSTTLGFSWQRLHCRFKEFCFSHKKLKLLVKILRTVQSMPVCPCEGNKLAVWGTGFGAPLLQQWMFAYIGFSGHKNWIHVPFFGSFNQKWTCCQQLNFYSHELDFVHQKLCFA